MLAFGDKKQQKELNGLLAEVRDQLALLFIHLSPEDAGGDGASSS